MLSRDINQNACDLHVMQSRVLLRHFKIIFFSFVIKIDSLSHIQTFHFLHFKSSSLLVHISNFHPMSNFTSLIGLLFQLTHTTPKSHFHISQSCRYYLQDKVTEVPVGHFRRLVYSTPNREGPYAPLRNYQIIYHNRLKN